MDYSSADPATNLALEEVLLDEVEHGRLPDMIRFWESPVPFVVLGTGQVLADEVYEAHCLEDGVQIMRRCTAGGCVLQGPGSLNFACFLTFDTFPEVAGLHASYDFILQKICTALARAGVNADMAGISDIAIGGRKVSGNAQRRRRNAILHHGTLLYKADTGAIARYLREPQDRPDYRGARGHKDFLAAIPAPPDALRDFIAEAFGGEPGSFVRPDPALLDRAALLSEEKYRTREWTHRR